MKLFNATNGAHWYRSTNWGRKSSSVCTWYGIQCDKNNCVDDIRIGSNELSGTIVPELSFLRAVTYLSLDGNDLKGTIPPELGSLKQLHFMDLRFNDLEGTIPEALGYPPDLGTLDLVHNKLCGTLPKSLDHVKYVDVGVLPKC
jgi:Leucine-rich repeat (LRR) protein